MMNEQQDYLSLKFGKLKEWNLHSDKAKELLNLYLKYAMDECIVVDIEVEKRMICDIIDACNANEIHLDFYDESISKEEAKQYVLHARPYASFFKRME